jgi:hypothetical protein
MYAQKLEGDAWIGERMDAAKIDKMSGLFPISRIRVCIVQRRRLILKIRVDQQLGQLYELMQAIQKKKQEEGDS